MKNQKGISSIIFIIIIVALLAVAGFFAYQYFLTKTNVQPQVQNQTDQTAGWKTYIDLRQRFNIEYPAGWQSIEDVKNDDVVFCPTSDENCSVNAVYVYVYTKGGAKDILNNWRQQGVGYKETNVTVNGNSAIEREESLCNGVPLLTNGVFIEGISNDYQIQGPISACGTAADKFQSNYSESLQIFNQMLSTFKFTK